ncbi:hypothetical protein PG984_007157 [Apiospora sp. TS-2023a]
MDHVAPLFKCLAHPVLEVPYLCDRSSYIYDDSGFICFPERKDIDSERLAVGDFSHIDIEHIGAFLQAWLWFGLLGKALGVRTEDTTVKPALGYRRFLKRRGSQIFLSSQTLMTAISDEKSRPRSTTDGSKLRICLEKANHFSSRIMDAPFIASALDASCPSNDVHPTILTLLTCQVLCHTLSHTFNIPLAQELDSLRLVDHLLLRGNWKKDEIRKLPEDVLFRYHLSYYRRASTYFIEPEVLTPIHTKQKCQCQNVSSSMFLKQASIVDTVVLVRITKDSSMPDFHEFKLGAHGNAPSFVAISHARPAGLGNDVDNYIPLCQAEKVQSLVAQAVGGKGSQGTYFWLDTWCIPVERQRRKQALLSARNVFSQAESVIVLDPPLEAQDIVTSQEALIRIRYSGWKSRLWTVREGFFAREILFRFARRFVALQETLSEFEQQIGDSRALTVLRPPTMWSASRDKPASDTELEPYHMARFEEDIMELKKNLEAADVPRAVKSDQTQLYKLLRLGFLSAAKFRYFLEEDEASQILGVCKAIKKVYDEEYSSKSEKDDAGSFRLRQIYDLTEQVWLEKG